MSKAVVTDERVYAAARAIWETWREHRGSDATWDEAVRAYQEPHKFPKLYDAVALCLDEARAALEAALSLPHAAEAVEPEQKPVAWYREGFLVNFSIGESRPWPATGDPNEWKPLFAHPVRSAQEAVKVRHKKRGTDYEVIGVGKMQSEHWRELVGEQILEEGAEVGSAVDMREVTIYRSVDDGQLWVRPREEFEDGRFDILTPGGETATPDTPAPVPQVVGSRTYAAVEAIIPLLDKETSLSPTTRSALVDLVSAFERDKHDQTEGDL